MQGTNTYTLIEAKILMEPKKLKKGKIDIIRW